MTKKTMNVTLWIVQALLAAVFLMSGISKQVMSPEAMKGPVALPVLFIRFIGVAEIAGALGLILPGIFRIRTELTPLAAAGLVIIMIGATTITLIGRMWGFAIVPAVMGLLAAFVAYERWKLIRAAA